MSATSQSRAAETDLLYLRDAYATDFTATVIGVRGGGVRGGGVPGGGVPGGGGSEDTPPAIALDRTLFYATGGGQPNDTGVLAGLPVVKVGKEGGPDGQLVWHTVSLDEGANADTALPEVGAEVAGSIDWKRRHELMRTHTALHILCGVIWNEWGVAVTGGNMEPLSARMDFEFDPLPEGFAGRITELVNAEIEADRPVEVSFLPRGEALADEDLIRTKVNLIPEFVTEIRVVDIVGLDKQADGGTHVASTKEVGRFAVTKTESKGKGNKRVRIALSSLD
ncbi:MAG: alanyl-tRNA editing protein [Acidimicrobiia bacterium]|nr:alanyl-tRNA editing protein [Acidimicrobiia bacterium]